MIILASMLSTIGLAEGKKYIVFTNQPKGSRIVSSLAKDDTSSNSDNKISLPSNGQDQEKTDFNQEPITSLEER